MLDGLVGTVSKFKLEKQPIYTRHESMMDVEKTVYYYPDASIWTVLSYFDPRRDQQHKNPLRIYVHRLSGQFENFLFSQLTLPQIEIRELESLHDLIQMNPSSVAFDLVLGWWDSQAWRTVFPFFGGKVFDSDTDDIVFIQRKVKIANYNHNGLQIKFYRMNIKENPDHRAKYPKGWDGYTKCEIVTPKFGDLRDTLVEDEHMALFQVLDLLQTLRVKLLADKWQAIQHEVATKTYARSAWINVWSSTEGVLQGALERVERELTERQRVRPHQYLQVLQRACNIEG